VSTPESIDFSTWKALADTGEFEPVLAALEESVTLLEQGGLSLATMTECYELGLKLSQRCTDLLRDAELRIVTLDQEYADRQAAGSLPGNREIDFEEDLDEDPPF
jgi:exodeoxyribonuclease VII small subunit